MLKVNQTDRINLLGQELNIPVSQIFVPKRHLTAFYIYLLPASSPGIMVAGDRGYSENNGGRYFKQWQGCILSEHNI